MFSLGELWQRKDNDFIIVIFDIDKSHIKKRYWNYNEHSWFRSDFDYHLYHYRKIV